MYIKNYEDIPRWAWYENDDKDISFNEAISEIYDPDDIELYDLYKDLMEDILL